MDPQRIGRYEVIGELGRGGMATVFLARDPHLDRQVAVKVLPRQFVQDKNFRERFRREARAIGRLNHDAIVGVHDFGEDDGQPYIVMEYMPGGTLAERLTGQPLPLADVLTILEPVAAALDSAHAAGIIHRDLKPANILFDQHGHAHVADFGIAQMADATQSITGTGLIGTPSYMSPEQAEGNADLTPASDIYSLGVIAYELLSGKPPFTASSMFALLRKHIQDVPPPLSVGGAIDNAVRAALAKDASTRPAKAGAFIESLGGLSPTVVAMQFTPEAVAAVSVTPPMAVIPQMAATPPPAVIRPLAATPPPAVTPPLAATRVVPPTVVDRDPRGPNTLTQFFRHTKLRNSVLGLAALGAIGGGIAMTALAGGDGSSPPAGPPTSLAAAGPAKPPTGTATTTQVTTATVRASATATNASTTAIARATPPATNVPEAVPATPTLTPVPPTATPTAPAPSPTTVAPTPTRTSTAAATPTRTSTVTGTPVPAVVSISCQQDLQDSSLVRCRASSNGNASLLQWTAHGSNQGIADGPEANWTYRASGSYTISVWESSERGGGASTTVKIQL